MGPTCPTKHRPSREILDHSRRFIPNTVRPFPSQDSSRAIPPAPAPLSLSLRVRALRYAKLDKLQAGSPQPPDGPSLHPRQRSRKATRLAPDRSAGQRADRHEQKKLSAVRSVTFCESAQTTQERLPTPHTPPHPV
ncbi:hypothetical protein P3342_005612 [Pyrenophora teres f. teres]|nr:hypothetical protein P3342_005612 [Pyrenophora teres f. teres]